MPAMAVLWVHDHGRGADLLVGPGRWLRERASPGWVVLRSERDLHALTELTDAEHCSPMPAEAVPLT
jgi:hypothetical protein